MYQYLIRTFRHPSPTPHPKPLVQPVTATPPTTTPRPPNANQRQRNPPLLQPQTLQCTAAEHGHTSARTRGTSSPATVTITSLTPLRYATGFAGTLNRCACVAISFTRDRNVTRSLQSWVLIKKTFWSTSQLKCIFRFFKWYHQKTRWCFGRNRE